MKTNNKWTVKDVITTVLLTVLLIGIHFVVITVSMVNQFFNCVLSPGVSMFFSAPVFFDVSDDSGRVFFADRQLISFW